MFTLVISSGVYKCRKVKTYSCSNLINLIRAQHKDQSMEFLWKYTTRKGWEMELPLHLEQFILLLRRIPLKPRRGFFSVIIITNHSPYQHMGCVVLRSKYAQHCFGLWCLTLTHFPHALMTMFILQSFDFLSLSAGGSELEPEVNNNSPKEVGRRLEPFSKLQVPYFHSLAQQHDGLMSPPMPRSQYASTSYLDHTSIAAPQVLFFLCRKTTIYSQIMAYKIQVRI